MSNEWEARPLDYYKVLQIDPSAEPEVIEAAYKKLSLKYHDDTSHRGDGKMKEINVAGGVLRDNVRRKEYDTWYRNYYGRDTASTSQPPKPVAEPNSVIVDDIVPGEKRTASFILKNEGGAVKGNCKIDPVNPQSGIRITAYKSLSSDLFPLRVEFEVAGGKWGTIATEFLRILLDGEECRVRVDVRARRFTFGAALRETGKFTVKVLHSLPMQGIRRVLVKKRRIPKWVGVMLVLVAIGYGWNMLASNFADNGTTLTRDLSQGMRGGDVSELQRHLAAAGVYSENVTGYFGDITEEAVKRYQRAHGIKPTGFVGPATRAALNASDTAPTPLEKSGTPDKLSSQLTAVASNPSPMPDAGEVKKMQPQTTEAKSGGAIPGKLTALIVDQLGKPVPSVNFWLVDPYGENITFPNRSTNENGRLQLDADDTRYGGVIPLGKYTLHIEKKYYDQLTMPVEIPASGLWLDKVILKKHGSIGGYVKNESGQTVTQAKFWLTDPQGEQVNISGFTSAGLTSETGRFETDPVPNGHYTLNIECAGHCLFGDTFARNTVDDSYAKWSKKLQIDVKDADVWFDEIVLIREG